MRQGRVTRQMTLEPKLIKLRIIKGAEFRRQAAECPDEPELRGDEVNDETEPRLPRKLEAMLGFTLHLHERISRREKVRIQVDAAVRRKSEVTNLVRGLERATHQVAAGPDVSRPGHRRDCRRPYRSLAWKRFKPRFSTSS